MLGSFNHLSMPKKLTVCLGAIIAITVGVDGVMGASVLSALDLSNGGPDGEDAAFGRAA
ncbi:hypothetical protein KV697_09600 [Sphingomonas sanguinis]|uniref:Uncharacterized protein n=1 Tax=Sphingomonas sanguinis TaxID=33051 RepID=A0ABU5LTH1_9SPHN|nr:hypothetical protein [Sphingomonas sanguinis]MDZ7283056.1 hypothetical protein [Sphingomonas sanguinis]QXT37493.1 hypothetical protein KV697_09600 [Sphingomonas sanguinis]